MAPNRLATMNFTIMNARILRREERLGRLLRPEEDKSGSQSLYKGMRNLVSSFHHVPAILFNHAL